MPKFQSLKGFRDFYPEDFAKRAYITDTWRLVARKHGFQEYDAPPLESLELYRHKSGDELVGQLYSFVDKGGREVALRPEMTPSVSRMVSERWQALPKPVKWFSIPQLFRYERPQAGRLREHFQFNADIFGDSSSLAEAEILAVVIDCFSAFGLTHEDVKIRLSDRRVLNRILESIGVSEQQSADVYSVLDKFYKQDAHVSEQRLLDVGLSLQTVNQLFAYIKKFSAISDRHELAEMLGGEDPFTRVLYDLHSLVSDASKWIELDLTIVRGLGYYTGTVFEAFDIERKFRAICGGGRYDNLLESLGGVAAPALGFGWGDVVLSDLLIEHKKFPAAAPIVDFAVFTTGNPRSEALELVRSLRALGFKATYAAGVVDDAKVIQSALKYSAKFHYGLMGAGPDHGWFYDVKAGKGVRHYIGHGLLSALTAFVATSRRLPTDEEIVDLANDSKLLKQSP